MQVLYAVILCSVWAEGPLKAALESDLRDEAPCEPELDV